uniref:RNase H type-1 domain-containing protein n=1 Tax=Nicotiana tabacum TaxID=4097 RepID=A0A1S4DMP1_TOBAC|nr:PREDICTED: uncharacterized protein LOC107831437 [Nicotiana tabacum]
MGSSLLWFENWIGLDLAEYIQHNIKPPVHDGMLDVPVWKLELRGEFSAKSAWDYMRRRRDPSTAYRNIWTKGMSFKVSFFMWKVWKNKLPLDDFFKRKVWHYFLAAAGIAVEGLTFYQAIMKCWTVQAIPRVIYQISTMLQLLVKYRKPSMQNIPHKWPDLVSMMKQYTPKLKYTKVLWELPEQGWIKDNTDGASRGNPGRSSFGYVLRNEEGNIVYACGKEIQEGTNTEAEVKAILEALKYCVDNDYILIDMHTNSMIIKNVLQGVWSIPWTIATEVRAILELMERCNLKLSHTLREGNQLADHIANYALDAGPMECHSFCDLDVKGKKIVNSDKLQRHI